MTVLRIVGNFLYHYLGLQGVGPWYAWHSGPGANFGEATIVVGAYAVWKHHTCHVDGCWRISRHTVEGTPYTTCKRHHPTIPNKVTAEHVANAHLDAIEIAHPLQGTS